MEILLLPALLVWSGAAFLGSRPAFREGRGPLPLRRLGRSAPAVLVLLGGAGLAAAVVLALTEVSAIRAREGAIGGYFTLAVLAGTAGAVALSAFLNLPRGRAPR